MIPETDTRLTQMLSHSLLSRGDEVALGRRIRRFTDNQQALILGAIHPSFSPLDKTLYFQAFNWLHNDAKEARETFAKHNVRLVAKIAWRYKNFLPLKDLVQEGVMALSGIAEGFDPDRGFRFSTFAYKRLMGRFNTLARQERHRKEKELRYATGQLTHNEKFGALQEVYEINPDFRDKLDGVIRTLPEAVQDTVKKHLDGKTLGQISRENNQPLSTVKDRWNQFKINLDKPEVRRLFLQK